MKNELSKAWRAVDSERVPPFAKTWRAAEKHDTARRYAYRRLASVAAVGAALFVGANLLSPTTGQDGYIEAAELLGSTSWRAPSDVLLPEHQIDLYQDMPTLIESTQAEGETLL